MPRGRVLYKEEGNHQQQQRQAHEEFDLIQHEPDDAVHASEVVEPIVVFSPAHEMHSSVPGCVPPNGLQPLGASLDRNRFCDNHTAHPLPWALAAVFSRLFETVERVKWSNGHGLEKNLKISKKNYQFAKFLI